MKNFDFILKTVINSLKVSGKIENFKLNLRDIEVKFEKIELTDNGSGASLSLETLVRPIREINDPAPATQVKKAVTEGGEQSGGVMISGLYVKKGTEVIEVGYLELDLSMDSFNTIMNLL